MAPIRDLLSPVVLTDVISQIAATSDWYQMLFGVQPGGKNEKYLGHRRDGAYHVFNNTRTAAQGRVPGAAAGSTQLQGMERVTYTYPRMFERGHLSAEELGNLAQIANPAARDKYGEDMISRQTKFLGQRAANWRKAMLIGQMRNSLYYGIRGDEMFWTYDSSVSGVLPVVNVRFGMPAGNQNRLNMLNAGNIIDGSWASNSTNIPLHLWNINAAFQTLCGGYLAAAVTTGAVMDAMMRNEFMRGVHGSVNQPFRILEQSDLDPVIAKTMKNVHRVVFSVLPNCVWYVTDEIIEVGPSTALSQEKVVEDNHVLFLGHQPDDGVVACNQGSELVAERDGAPMEDRIGMSAWNVTRADPTGIDIYNLDNALVFSQVPNAQAYGEVIF